MADTTKQQQRTKIVGSQVGHLLPAGRHRSTKKAVRRKTVIKA